MAGQRRRWSMRYRTTAGQCPLQSLLVYVPSAHAALDAALQEVQDAADLAGYRVPGSNSIYRQRASVGSKCYLILFAVHPAKPDVLLGLVAVPEKLENYPGENIRLAETRLHDWHTQARPAQLRDG